MSKLCVYCMEIDASDSEHVFPHGLGGEKSYLDCVCDECNSIFSGLEGELMQNAPPAIMRSVEGIKGYSKTFHKTPLKNAIVLMEDKNTGIPYESGQKYQFEPFLRTQIILIDNRLYIESGNDKEYKYFIKQIFAWMKDILTAVYLSSPNDDGLYSGVKFELAGSITEEQIQVAKVRNEIRIETLSPTHDQFDKYVPRLFLNDSKKLILRAKTNDEAKDFLLFFLKNRGQHIASLSPELSEEVSVYQNFDPVKTERALVKIGLNCLMHYYPETANEEALRPLKDFVLYGDPFNTKMHALGLKMIDETFRECHTVGFFQQPEGLLIRIALFSGSFNFSFVVVGFQVMQSNTFTLMKVDYNARRHEFLQFEKILECINSSDNSI